MSAKTSDDGHLIGAAPEDELLRLERSYRDLAEAKRAAGLPRGKMRRILSPPMPPPEPEFRTGTLA